MDVMIIRDDYNNIRDIDGSKFDKNRLVNIIGTDRVGYFYNERLDGDLDDNLIKVSTRHGEDWGIPISIEDNVGINWFGDLIISKETYNTIKTDKELLYENEEGVLDFYNEMGDME